MEPSVKLQKRIKDNSLELQDFMADLHKWEKDMKDQEKLSSPAPSPSLEDLPPIRCKKPDVTDKIITNNKERSKDVGPEKKKDRISSYDYAAWDKFDVDKALVSSSEEESDTETQPVKKVSKGQSVHRSGMKSSGNKKKENVTKMKDESSGNELKASDSSPKAANSKDDLSISGLSIPNDKQKEKALKLKDEGNKFYSSGHLDYAIAKYTQGLALDPTNPILPANRAMAYIKLEKYEAAEADCTKSLKLDSNYIKAYLRRGTCRLKLQKLPLAAEDFKKVLELESWNKDAKKELEKLEGHFNKGAEDKDAQIEKNHKNSDKAAKKEESIKSVQLTNQSVKASSDFNSMSDKSSGKKRSEEAKRGKKLKIVEVDSSQDQCQITSSNNSSKNADTVTPVTKLPHQRSQQPLRRVQVVDVASENVIPEEISPPLSSKNAKSSTPSSEETKSSMSTSKKTKSSKSLSKETKAASSMSEEKSKDLSSSEVKDSMNSDKSKDSVSSQSEKSPDEALRANVPLPGVPRTSHQFSQDWKRVTQCRPQAVAYLKAIPPTFFQNVDLESDGLVDLVKALTWNEIASQDAVSYLSALTKSDGFSVNLMFLDDGQKKVFEAIIKKCEDQRKEHGDLLDRVEKNLL